MNKSILWLGGLGVSIAIVFLLATLRHSDIDANDIAVDDNSEARANARSASSGVQLSSESTVANFGTDPNSNESIVDGSENKAQIAAAEYEVLNRDFRQTFAQGVSDDYSQLFRHLGMGSDLQESLVNFLVEERMTDSSVDQEGESYPGGYDVRTMRLEEILGEELLSEYLALEKDISSYAEVGRIGPMLAQRDLQLSESQADRLFEAHAQVLGNYESEIVEGVSPAIELVVSEMADKMRLLIEGAPAFLSPQQVQALAAHYDDLTRRRLQSLEQQTIQAHRDQTGQPPIVFPAE